MPRRTTSTLSTCGSLGVPVGTEKIEGPTTCLTFLSLQFNMLEKNCDYTQKSWIDFAVSSPLGCPGNPALKRAPGAHRHTVACSSGSAPGCPFHHRLYNLMKQARCKDFKLCLNIGARSDILLWWQPLPIHLERPINTATEPTPAPGNIRHLGLLELRWLLGWQVVPTSMASPTEVREHSLPGTYPNHSSSRCLERALGESPHNLLLWQWSGRACREQRDSQRSYPGSHHALPIFLQGIFLIFTHGNTCCWYQ